MAIGDGELVIDNGRLGKVLPSPLFPVPSSQSPVPTLTVQITSTLLYDKPIVL